MKIKLSGIGIRKYLIIINLVFIAVRVVAQDTTAIMVLDTNMQGVLFPRMTTAQRLAIDNPANALTVFDSDKKSYWQFQSNHWEEIYKSTAVFGLNDSNFAIPDPGSIQSTISLLSPDTVVSGMSIEVCINILHPYTGVVRVSLVSPENGVTMDLSSNNGGSSQNYLNTCFTTFATTSITSGAAPYTGDFIPEAPFSSLLHEPIGGLWTLIVSDDDGVVDNGALLDWSIRFSATDSLGNTLFYGQTNLGADIVVDSSTQFNNKVQAGTWNSGYPGQNTQLLLSGQFDSGTNLGSTQGSHKLLIEGYNNDSGDSVFPIYVLDENSQIDFFLQNRSSESSLPLALFSGTVGIGIENPSPELFSLYVNSGNAGTSPDWISASFGARNVGDRVVFGNYNGRVVVGGHDDSLNAWTDLYINPEGGKVGFGYLSDAPSVSLSVEDGIYMEDPGDGLILTSQNGNCFTMTVANDGMITTTPIPCPQ